VLGSLSNPSAFQSFSGWGVPLPTLNVYAVRRSRPCVGLVAASVRRRGSARSPLIFTILVAYATAHREQVFDDPLGLPAGAATLFVKAPRSGTSDGALVLLFRAGPPLARRPAQVVLDRVFCPTLAAGRVGGPPDRGRGRRSDRRIPPVRNSPPSHK